VNQVYIGFERDPGLVPWLIRKLTRFDYNHILFLYQSADWGGEWTFESVYGRGVRTVPLRATRKIHERYLVKYDIAPDIRANQELFLQQYDLLGLILFGVWILLKSATRLRLSFNGLKLKGQTCSEVLATVLRNRFYAELEFPQWVNPKDIWNLMQFRPDDFEKVDG